MNIYNYGFAFNDISIQGNTFNKKSKNEIGKEKINNEIHFYLYVLENNIHFPTPKLLQYTDGSLTIEHILHSTTLTHVINSDNIKEYLNTIKYYMYNIHTIKRCIPRQVIKSDLIFEIKTKVLNRFNGYDWNSNSLFTSIKSVNCIVFKNIDYYCKIIETRLTYLLKDRSYYNLIHGDLHLGNILINDDNKIYFIDPRGVFGKSKLFGLYEYDYAKLLFGLSGYSIFDNMNIDKLDINNNNITIDFIKNYEFIFNDADFDDISILLCLSIWLANNSCFENIHKKITSLMIAFYYCEKYITHNFNTL